MKVIRACFSSRMSLLGIAGLLFQPTLSLDAINAALSHSFSDSPNLTTAVVGAHRLFANVASFTLVTAFRQMGWLPDEGMDDASDARDGVVFVAHHGSYTQTCPSSENLAAGVSSKVSGKRRATRPEQPEVSLSSLAARIGKNGFIPTDEWV
jgi:hypothetical protein